MVSRRGFFGRAAAGAASTVVNGSGAVAAGSPQALPIVLAQYASKLLQLTRTAHKLKLPDFGDEGFFEFYEQGAVQSCFDERTKNLAELQKEVTEATAALQSLTESAAGGTLRIPQSFYDEAFVKEHAEALFPRGQSYTLDGLKELSETAITSANAKVASLRPLLPSASKAMDAGIVARDNIMQALTQGRVVLSNTRDQQRIYNMMSDIIRETAGKDWRDTNWYDNPSFSSAERAQELIPQMREKSQSFRETYDRIQSELAEQIKRETTQTKATEHL